jgi:hypothetical protein
MAEFGQRRVLSGVEQDSNAPDINAEIRTDLLPKSMTKPLS